MDSSMLFQSLLALPLVFIVIGVVVMVKNKAVGGRTSGIRIFGLILIILSLLILLFQAFLLMGAPSWRIS